MARRNNQLVNVVRYNLLIIGAFYLIANWHNPQNTMDAWATSCVIVGFPYSLIPLAFRPVVWLLRLFGIVKRKPAPVPKVRVEVTCETSEAEWGDEPATDKQLGFIRHLGGDPPDDLTKGEASEMIDALLVDKNEQLLARAEFKRDRKANAAKSSLTRISLP
jgi:hypothetical protein